MFFKTYKGFSFLLTLKIDLQVSSFRLLLIKKLKAECKFKTFI